MDATRDHMVELDDRDRDVLEVLAEGRANPRHIRNETGLGKGDTNTVLVRLGRSGYVEQVSRGLYRITSKGREELGLQPSAECEHRAGVDVAALRHAVDDLEAALERGDKATAQKRLQDIRSELDDAE